MSLGTPGAVLEEYARQRPEWRNAVPTVDRLARMAEEIRLPRVLTPLPFEGTVAVIPGDGLGKQRALTPSQQIVPWVGLTRLPDACGTSHARYVSGSRRRLLDAKPQAKHVKPCVAHQTLATLAAKNSGDPVFRCIASIAGVDASLRHCNITDADVVAVSCALHAHPHIRKLDLSRNPITDSGARLLLETLGFVRNVTSIVVDDTYITRGTRLKLEAQCAANDEHCQRKEAAIAARRRKAFLEAAERDLSDGAVSLWRLQCAARLQVEEDCKFARRRLRQAFGVSLRRAYKRETRRELQCYHASLRILQEAKEQEQRCILLELFDDAVLALVLVGESHVRSAVAEAFMASLKAMKRRETEECAEARRTEKAELAQQARRRESLACSEGNVRTLLAKEWFGDFAVLGRREKDDRAAAVEMQRRREEEEEAEERRKEAEVRRLQIEELCRREKETLEEQRRHEAERAARAAVEKREVGERTGVGADEAAARVAYTDMAAVDRAVANRRSFLAERESMLLTSWQHHPELTISFSTERTRVFYECPLQPPSCLDLDIRLASSMVPEAQADSFATMREGLCVAREKLREELTAASHAVRAHGVRWNEAITYGAKSKNKPPLPLYPGLRYSPANDTALEEPKWMCDDTTRLAVKGGTLTVSAGTTDLQNNTTEALPSLLSFTRPSRAVKSPRVTRHLSSANRVGVGKDEFQQPFGLIAQCLTDESPAGEPMPEITMSLEEGVSLAEIETLLNSLQYKFRGANGFPFVRAIRVKLKLLYPALASDCNPRVQRFQSVSDAFSSVVEVEAEGTGHVVIAPVTSTTKVVEWVEARDQEKPAEERGVALVSVEALVRPPAVLGPNRMDVEEGPVAGGKLHLRVIANASASDYLCLRTGLMCDDTTFERHDVELCPKRQFVVCEGVAFAEITDGTLPSLRELVETGPSLHPANGSQGCGITFLETADYRLLQRVLRRLKFAIVSRNLPAAQDRRTVEITVSDSVRNQYIIHVGVDVVPSDKPTTLLLGPSRVFYRQPSHPMIPLARRQYIASSEMPLFPQAVVHDVDTDHFCGGSLDILVTGMVKGDNFYIAPRNENGVTVSDNCIAVNETYVGAVDQGASVLPHFDKLSDTLGKRSRSLARSRNSISLRASLKKSSANSPSGDVSHDIKIRFLTNGAASLEAVQAILRSIHYIPAHVTPADGSRVLTVILRVGGPHKGISEPAADGGKAAALALFESPRRLSKDRGSFASLMAGDVAENQVLEERMEMKVTGPLIEVAPALMDIEYREGSGLMRLAPFDVPQEHQDGNFEGGYIRVEVVKGESSDDVVFVKSGLREDCKVKERRTGNTGSSPRTSQASPRAVEGLTSPDTKSRGKQKKLLQPINGPAAFNAAKEVDNPQLGVLYDFWCTGKYVGTLLPTESQLMIRFSGKGIGRREVQMCLRALAYSNERNSPLQLDKILRVTLKDNGYSVSQALLHMNVKAVDDVTDIVLTTTRSRVRPGQLRSLLLGCYPLTELGRCHLSDPRTQWFDGGRFAAEFTSGAVKGDAVAFLTPEQQKIARAMFATRERPVWDGELVVAGSTLSTAEGLEVGQLEFTKSAFPGVSDLRVSFAEHDPPSITILLATYVMNCLAFVCSAERIVAGQRVLSLKIADADNPTEGRTKIVLDVAKPLLFVGGAKTPFLVQKPCSLGTPVVLAERLAIGTGDGRPMNLDKGYTQVSFSDAHADDEIALPATAAIKDGILRLNDEYIGGATVSQQMILVQHNSTPPKLLAALLVQVAVVCSRQSDSQRQVRIQCTDSSEADPSVIDIELNPGVA
ncbi:hypothetical protein DIPPA_04153 [Diplonema papillatum]|nr:hypothetical protein DIPPA_04153 [Diplonema papillatum]